MISSAVAWETSPFSPASRSPWETSQKEVERKSSAWRHHSIQLRGSERHSSQQTSSPGVSMAKTAGQMWRKGAKEMTQIRTTSWRCWTLDRGLTRVVEFLRVSGSSLPICFSGDTLGYARIPSNCLSHSLPARPLCAIRASAPFRPHHRPRLLELLSSGTSLEVGLGWWGETANAHWLINAFFWNGRMSHLHACYWPKEVTWLHLSPMWGRLGGVYEQ